MLVDAFDESAYKSEKTKRVHFEYLKKIDN